MSKLIAFEFLSLDGFMAGEPGREMDWVQRRFNGAMEADLRAQYEALGAFLMGRRTYESLAGYWPTVTVEQEPLADHMNGLEKIVCSRTLRRAEWSNSRIVEGDLAGAVQKLKARPGKDVMVVGSASVVRQLSRRGLIDEYRFFLFPVVLGGGKPLFEGIARRVPLELARTHTFENGVVRMDFRRGAMPRLSAA